MYALLSDCNKFLNEHFRYRDECFLHSNYIGTNFWEDDTLLFHCVLLVGKKPFFGSEMLQGPTRISMTI